jgi:hypothetical protein
MKIIDREAAQGDLYIRRVEALPKGVREVPPTNGRHVVAHSETGHDHYVRASGNAIGFYESKDPLVCYLRNESMAMSELIHAREFDTHESHGLPPGIWEIRRQREMSPEGWRQVQD